MLYVSDKSVRGLGSEQVAAVLRQSSAVVRLVVARCILEPLPHLNMPLAPVILTSQLEDHLHHVVTNGDLVDYHTPADDNNTEASHAWDSCVIARIHCNV